MFEKGHKGYRKKGTPNKITAEQREKLKEVIDLNIEELKKKHATLTNAERISFVNSSLKYVIPTLKQIEVNLPPLEAVREADLSESEIIELLEVLKTKYDESKREEE